MTYTILTDTSDDALVAALQRLVRNERQVTVHVIAHLAEVERRRIHVAAGFPSLFAYCTGALGLSEHEAFHRILAARTASRFPVILDMLDERRLNLTTVRLVAQYLTDDNHLDILAAVAGKTRREVEVAMAARYPRPDVRTSVRRLAKPVAARLAISSPAAPPACERTPSDSDKRGDADPAMAAAAASVAESLSRGPRTLPRCGRQPFDRSRPSGITSASRPPPR